MNIHASAVVSPEACIGRDVTIGPFCVVEAGAEIGDACTLESRAVVKSNTTLGPHNHVYEGAVLGGLPQHTGRGERCGRLIVGSHNTIRENATIHCGMEEHDATFIGNHNMIMINAHIAHDCHIGSHVVIINNVMLAGHVTVGDRVYLAGAAGGQQFRRIGRLAAVGGQGRVVKDLPPFVTLDGFANGVVGLNLVGLRRAGMTTAEIRQLKDAYRLIYRSGLRWEEVLSRLSTEFPQGPAAEFHEFFSTGRFGFMPERRTPAAATIRLFPDAGDDRGLQARAG